MTNNHLSRYLRVRNKIIREFLSECLGTFVLVSFAVSCGAQAKLSNGAHGSFLSINLAGGLGVAMAIWVSGAASGGCVNPAVSLAFCLSNRLPWRHFPYHVTAQFTGAFLASGVIYGVYSEALDNYDGGNRTVSGPLATADIFCSYPQDYLSAKGGLVDQIVGTFFLVLPILSLVDPKNSGSKPWFSPLAIGLLVFCIGACLGTNCGYPINPTRDLGPRVFTLIGGWGREVFSYRNYNWFWVPLLGPMLGSVIAVFIYKLMIELHWPRDEIDDIEVKVTEKERNHVSESLPRIRIIGQSNFGFNSDDNKDLEY